MKLRAWLEAKKISQAAFAALIGKSQQSISNYCEGRVPDPDVMVEIRRATDGAVGAQDWYPEEALHDPRHDHAFEGESA